MVIVDSTVWIHYLRTPNTPIGQELVRLLDGDRVAVVGVVLAEVLQGTRDEQGYASLLALMDQLPYLESTKAVWTRAARISSVLRAEGRLTPLTDLVIAAAALESGDEVYTLDEHFQRVQGLKLYPGADGITPQPPSPPSTR